MKDCLSSFSQSIGDCISVVEFLGEEEFEKDNKSYKNIQTKMNTIKSNLKNQFNMMVLVTEVNF